MYTILVSKSIMKPYYFLSGEINAITVNVLIDSMLKRTTIDVQEPANFYISSTGGDLDSAIRLYDFIMASDVRLTTVGYGQIDSAALILFLAGEIRKIEKNCRVRLHLPIYNGPQSQVLSVHLETVSLFQKLDSRYYEIISKKLHKPFGQIQKIFTKGKILNSREAVDFGIATEIIEKIPINRDP